MSLEWFPKHPTLDAYRVNGHYAPYALLARDVRFSDAELAAEMWLAVDERTRDAANIMSGRNFENPHAQRAFNRSIEIAKTIHRFGTYPHFDETTKE